MSHNLTSVVWGGVSAPVSFDYLASPGNCDYYGFARDYCLDGCGHTGVEIGLVCGTPIYAAAPGIITCAGTGVGTGYDSSGCAAYFDVDCGGGTGRIEQQLDDGRVIIYGHMQTATVNVGQQVDTGDQIGTSGGDNGPHLHFELRIPNQGCAAFGGYAIVNPEPLLMNTEEPQPPSPPSTVQFKEGDTVETTTANLNLRTGPGLSYPVIAAMPLGRNGIILQGPTQANGYRWYRIETRQGRGWAAGEFLAAASFINVLPNSTADTNLNNIFPNRTDSSSISRQSFDGNVRVQVENDGTNVGEGVRYESLDNLGWIVPKYFGGIVHNLRRVPGSTVDLDLIRMTIFYTDGTSANSGAVGVELDDSWQVIVLKSMASDPNKTIKKVALHVTCNAPFGTPFSYYVDNARIIQL